MSGGEEMRTVWIGSIPRDATNRELDNLCRFIPGFQAAKPSKETMFVLFDCNENATYAILALNGQPFDRLYAGQQEPLVAKMAKSNMRTDAAMDPKMQADAYRGSNGSYGSYSAPSWQERSPGGYGGGGSYTENNKRAHESSYGSSNPKFANQSGGIDTVACVGAADLGVDNAQLEQFFSSLPGFIAAKANAKMGGGFFKFKSPTLAEQAVLAARESGLPAAMAKTKHD